MQINLTNSHSETSFPHPTLYQPSNYTIMALSRKKNVQSVNRYTRNFTPTFRIVQVHRSHDGVKLKQSFSFPSVELTLVRNILLTTYVALRGQVNMRYDGFSAYASSLGWSSRQRNASSSVLSRRGRRNGWQ